MVKLACTVAVPPAARSGERRVGKGWGMGLLLGSWFSRIMVLVAAAVAVAWVFTTTVTVSEPPALSEVLLNDTLCGIRSGWFVTGAETVIAEELALSLVTLLCDRALSLST